MSQNPAKQRFKRGLRISVMAFNHVRTRRKIKMDRSLSTGKHVGDHRFVDRVAIVGWVPRPEGQTIGKSIRTTDLATQHQINVHPSRCRSMLQIGGPCVQVLGCFNWSANVESHPARTDRSLPTEGGPFGYRGVACRWQRIVSGSPTATAGVIVSVWSRRGKTPTAQPDGQRNRHPGQPCEAEFGWDQNVRPGNRPPLPHPDRAPPASRPRTTSIPTAHHQHPDRDTSSAASDPGSSATDKRDLAAVTLDHGAAGVDVDFKIRSATAAPVHAMVQESRCAAEFG